MTATIQHLFILCFMSILLPRILFYTSILIYFIYNIYFIKNRRICQLLLLLNMLMPAQVNSFTHERAQLVLRGCGGEYLICFHLEVIGRVPAGVKDDDAIGHREVEAQPARPRGDQEQKGGQRGVEVVH